MDTLYDEALIEGAKLERKDILSFFPERLEGFSFLLISFTPLRD